MRHRLATPTGAGEMTRGEARRILHGSCLSKHQIPDRAPARRSARSLAARTGRPMESYRCPFSAVLGESDHWHVGSTPALDQLARIALAIRWFHDHPGDAR